MSSTASKTEGIAPSPPAVIPPAPAATSSSSFSAFSPLTNAYNRLNEWRMSLGLPNPGTVEGIQKEVKATHLTNYIFDGARADIAKSLSVNPAFQLTHSLSLASQTAPPSYNFGAVFANQNVFLQGGMDHDGSLSARLNQGWSGSNVSKMQCQLSNTPGHSMIQLEHDYSGLDFSANIKTINPSVTDGTGIYLGSYLQSFTKNLALGVETLYQRQAPGQEELTASYLLKYTGTNRDWIATAQLQPAGMLQATYYHKLSPKVEVAADLQLIAAPTRRDAVATVGCRYDLRMAMFRAQLDSTGKVSMLLEQRFAPALSFLVAGEIDHFKNTSKVGVGVMIESSTLTPEEMAALPPP